MPQYSDPYDQDTRQPDYTPQPPDTPPVYTPPDYQWGLPYNPADSSWPAPSTPQPTQGGWATNPGTAQNPSTQPPPQAYSWPEQNNNPPPQATESPSPQRNLPASYPAGSWVGAGPQGLRYYTYAPLGGEGWTPDQAPPNPWVRPFQPGLDITPGQPGRDYNPYPAYPAGYQLGNPRFPYQPSAGAGAFAYRDKDGNWVAPVGPNLPPYGQQWGNPPNTTPTTPTQAPATTGSGTAAKAATTTSSGGGGRGGGGGGKAAIAAPPAWWLEMFKRYNKRDATETDYQVYNGVMAIHPAWLQNEWERYFARLQRQPNFIPPQTSYGTGGGV